VERYRQLRAAGHTTLVVSHDPKLIAAFCDRALLLENGSITMEGPADEVAGAYLAHLTHEGRVA
jgi:ABC-type polysaccharide/polyol phosphate transport system ATPase subunit